MENAAGPFKVPMVVAQDLAIIMGFVDPPQPEIWPSKDLKIFGRNGISKDKPELPHEDDISSSRGTDSENEVEAEVDPACRVAPEPDDSDSDSTSSSKSQSSFTCKDHKKRKSNSAIVDLDEDGPPPPAAYVPSTHELPPTAIPIPPLPDPSTLPLDPLQYVGELVTVLQNTVIVRDAGTELPRTRRDAALDEGSLLLFKDRTILGHVWETFGPTALPHYVVRINRIGSSENKKSENTADLSSDLPSTHEHIHAPDPSKLKVSTAIYHIPSLSNFVFPSALARLKGSDASNLHDEEPAEHELEFSDDEAEAAHKRRRSHGPPSRASSTVPRQGEYETMADAGSLYGASPYDDANNFPACTLPSSYLTPKNLTDTPANTPLGDPAVHDALVAARNSRNRRYSMSIPSADTSMYNTAGPSRIPQDPVCSRGKSRGRGRKRAAGHSRPGQSHASFSFDEYDPHMPRPPSPTSLAIARATGQWRDGTPFIYPSTVPLPPSSPPGATCQPHIYYDAHVHPVAPHINPRFAFAQGFGVQPSSAVQPAVAPFPPVIGVDNPDLQTHSSSMDDLELVGE